MYRSTSHFLPPLDEPIRSLITLALQSALGTDWRIEHAEHYVVAGRANSPLSLCITVSAHDADAVDFAIETALECIECKRFRASFTELTRATENESTAQCSPLHFWLSGACAAADAAAEGFE